MSDIEIVIKMEEILQSLEQMKSKYRLAGTHRIPAQLVEIEVMAKKVAGEVFLRIEESKR